jgi:hypothetical protein
MGEAIKEVAAGHSFHSQDRTAAIGGGLQSSKIGLGGGRQKTTTYILLDFFGRPLMTITNYTTPRGTNSSDSAEFLKITFKPGYPTAFSC